VVRTPPELTVALVQRVDGSEARFDTSG
jgi:hypothetical protein